MSVQFVPLVCLVVGLLVSFGAFALAWRAASSLSPSSPPPDSARWSIAAAVACLAVLVGVTRPTAEPFSSGQSLGEGIALGGLCALIGFGLRRQLRPRFAASLDSLQLTGLWTPGELALCVVPVAAALWRWIDDPTHALMGVALGQLVVRWLVVANDDEAGATEEALGVFGVGIAVASTLAVLHDASGILASATLTQRHLLWQVPLMFATGTCVTSLVANRALTVRKPLLNVLAASTILATVLNLALAGWLSLAVFRSRVLLWPLALGLVAGLFLLALIALAGPVNGTPATERGWGGNSEPGRSRVHLPPTGLGWLVGLIVLGVWAESFLRLAGYGVALATVGMLSLSAIVVALTISHDDSPRAAFVARVGTQAAGFWLIAALARVFVTRTDFGERELSVLNHYVLTGLAMGVVLPLLAAQTRTFALAVEGGGQPLRQTAATLLCGSSVFFLVVLTPLFFRLRASAGLMAGLVIAQAMLLVHAMAAPHSGRGQPPPILLFILGVGLLAAQLTPHLTEFTGLLQRPHKLAIVALLLALLFTWFVISLRAQARNAKEASQS